jgi:ABC-2 type transport system permease protein
VIGALAALRRTARMAAHELRVVLTNLRFTVALFGIPIVITGLVNFVLQEPGLPPDRLAIQDLDNSTLSRRLTQQLQAWPGLKTEKLAAVDDARDLVDKQPDVIAMVIPAGLNDAVLQGNPMQLKQYVNRAGAAQNQPAATAVFNAGVEVSAVAAAVATARLDASRRRADENGAAQAAETTALQKFNLRRNRLNTTTLGDRPISGFTKQSAFATEEGISLIEFVAVMLALLMVEDREHGRLTRLLWTRLRLTQLVVAKGLSIFLLCSLAMAAIIAISVYFGMGMGPSLPLLGLVTLVTAFAVTGYSLLLLGLGHWAPHVVQLVGVVATVALSVFGGSLVPSENLPGVVQLLGSLTPNERATEAYHALLLHGETGGGGLWVPLLVLVALGLLQAVAGARVLVYAMRNAH